MSRFVVDASVVVKWLVPEVHTADAERYLDSAHELIGPDLMISEVANTLWKKVRLREVDSGSARSLLVALRRIPVALFPSAPLVDAAFEIAMETDRAVYDCIYIALAVAREGVFVTADQKCQRALRKGRFGKYVRRVGEA